MEQRQELSDILWLANDVVSISLGSDLGLGAPSGSGFEAYGGRSFHYFVGLLRFLFSFERNCDS